MLKKRYTFKVMLHVTNRNKDFERNAALQCWNNSATIPNNIATMMKHCVSLNIVVANFPE